jgi:hypothetical protein
MKNAIATFLLLPLLLVAGCSKQDPTTRFPAETAEQVTFPLETDERAVQTWEVTARFGITYRLFSPSHLPSGYYVEVLHVDTPRIIRKPYKPTVDDVDWGPNLEGFEISAISVKGVTVNRLY